MNFRGLIGRLADQIMWKLGRRASLPHYVRDYRQHVDALLEAHPKERAMSLAVGGEFQSFGIALRDFVIQCGLTESMTLVDVGCGSGRLAFMLRHMKIDYLGTDVVPKLVKYARTICARPDWRFELVDGLTIPAADSSADMVTFFSVFTHLRHEESYIYLAEAKRVLKPNGAVVFTFLDFALPGHWLIFERFVERVRAGGNLMHVDQFIDKTALTAWAEHLGFKVDRIFDGTEPYVRLSEDVVRDDGSKISGQMWLGQSACVLRKM
jgi:ubiquinone/menaquinone biosynthesis C-methylase UbiE